MRSNEPAPESVGTGSSSLSGDEPTVGRIHRPHGMDGEVQVEILTDRPERFESGSVLIPEPLPDETTSRLTVESTRTHQDRLLVQFREISGRTDAEQLAPCDLKPQPGTSEGSDVDDYLDVRELLEATVDAPPHFQGRSVRDLKQTEAQPVMVVDLPENRELWLPLHEDTVDSYDESGRLTVSLPTGWSKLVRDPS